MSSSSAPPLATEGILASTDLSLFLQPSFDASSYVSSLLSTTAASAPDPSTSTLLQPITPTSPGATRKSSISLSPSPLHPPTSLAPTTAAASSSSSRVESAKERKRAQDQEEVDLSLAISRLNLAIEELDRSISTEVNANAPALLQRTSGLAGMQEGVGRTREGIQSLDAEVGTLRKRVHEPFVRLQELQLDLKRFDRAGELVGRAGKFVGLARRLESQMESLFSRKEASKAANGEEEGEDAVVGPVHGRDLARAALLISELAALINDETTVQEATTPASEAAECSLLQLKMVQDLLPVIESARKTVVDYMEDMIVRGLRDLSPVMLAGSLQVAFNLGTLPALVKDLLSDLTEVVKERTAAAFDLDALSRQLNLSLPTLESTATSGYAAYRSGRRGGTSGEYTRAEEQKLFEELLWRRLESLLVVEMGAVCSKVYLLEKVLKLKTDSETGVNFLAAALEVLGDKPSYTFWLTLSSSLQTQVAAASAKSGWVRETVLVGGYGRLLRMVHEFFAKIGVYTDVVYGGVGGKESPEAVVLIRSLGGLERGFVDRTTAGVAQSLNQVLARQRGGEEEGEVVVRAITNALDATRFDPLLSRATVDRCVALVEQFAERLGGVVAKDASAWSIHSGEMPATSAQIWNASLVRFSYTVVQGLKSIAEDQDPSNTSSSPAAGNTTEAAAGSSTTSYTSAKPSPSSAKLVVAAQTHILAPLLTHFYTSISGSMAKMHTQLASASSSSVPQGKNGGVSIDSTSGASSYISEVCELLWHLRDRLLPLYPAAVRFELAKKVAERAVEVFLLNAAMLSLPAEAEGKEDGGDRMKLKLATDMTELAFALAQLDVTRSMSSGKVEGAEWMPVQEDRLFEGSQDVGKALKAFRRTLFLSLAEIETEVGDSTTGSLELPNAVLMLHVLSRQDKGVVERLIAGGGEGGGGKKPSASARSEFVRSILRDPSVLFTDLSSLLLQDSGLDPHARRFLTLLTPSLQP